MSKRDRDVILRRRARFITVALASVGLAGSLESCKREPQPCLSPPISDPEPTAEPTPCLSVAQPEDAGTETPTDAGTEEDAGPPPQPCLSPVAPDKPPPRPCLSVLPPQDKKK